MKKGIIYVPVAIILFLCGCATTPIGSTRFPEPAPTFYPKQTYNVTYDKMWESVMSILDIYRMPVASSDKENGRIGTDYIQGQAQQMGIFGGALSTRYKYFINLERKDQSTVKLKIICKLESSGASIGGSLDWHDIGNDNRDTVTKLENWLYEQIEKIL